jgi:predicted Fe-Mo cluster-binding NifX family protein
MKIAMPLAEGQLCAHFGHCQQFGIATVEDGSIAGWEMLAPPAHEPGALPRWLRERGVDVVLAGGMGRRAQGFFQQFGIEVVVGVEPGPPQSIVEAYLDGSLEAGANVCDH